MNMENPRRYLIACLLAAMAIVAGLGLFVVAVDPYRAFDSPTIEGLNALKPRAMERGNVAKSRILARLNPRTLLLGNSRVEVGFDPQSPFWPGSWRPVMNGAQAGTGLRVALCRLNEAVEKTELQFVILGIDIQDFLVHEAPPNGHGQAFCDDELALWRSLVGIDSVVDSALTLLQQDPQTGITMNADGFNPGRDNMVHVKRIGYRQLFAAKIDAYRKDYARKPAPMFEHPERYAPFRDLAAILRVTAAKNIRLVLFMHPYHAQYLDMLKEMHLMPSFEAWKRQIYALIDAENRHRTEPVRVLDFSGYNEISTELVPQKGENDTRWYWEPGHYKKALGDRIIQAIVKNEEDN